MENQPQQIKLAQTIQNFVRIKAEARSANTARTYQNAMKVFTLSLEKHSIYPDHTSPTDLPEDAVAWFASDLKFYAPSTERLYLTAVIQFYEFLTAERLSAPNLPRLRSLVKQRSRRQGVRLPQFPQDKIVNVLNYTRELSGQLAGDPNERLRNLRDRAFLFTLADTGLRIHEACSLRRGDLDWNEGRSVIIGKGDKQAVVRFSSRCLSFLKDYLAVRASLDGDSGKPLASLPLFARHDKGAGKKVKPITTATGRNIVHQRVKESLGEDAVGLITPHSFRHYFVTTVLRASGNLKLAQELARHKNIAVTQRYAHLNDDELDQGYHEVFEK